MKALCKRLIPLLCAVALLLPGISLKSDAATVESLLPVLGTTYTLTGFHEGNLPFLSHDVAGDYGLSYYAAEYGSLKEMTYKEDANQWFYWDGNGDVAVSFYPVQWEWSMQVIPANYAYPVLCYEFPRSGTVSFLFRGSSDPANQMDFYVTKNGISPTQKLTGEDGIYTEEVKKGDKFYMHCKSDASAPKGLYGAVSAQVTYTEFGQEEPEKDPTEGLTFLSAFDERLNYEGRWKDGEGARLSYWTSPSVSFSFTGKKLFIELARKSDIAVELDGKLTDYRFSQGKVEILVPSDGEHTVKVYGPAMQLKGFYLEPEAAVTAIPKKDRYIMFIGASFEASRASYSFQLGNMLGWDWQVFAFGGMSLSDGCGWYTADSQKTEGWGYYYNGYDNTVDFAMEGWTTAHRVGMETAFFNYERPCDKLENFTPYDFSNDRQPDVIVINLAGGNDYLHDAEESRIAEYVEDYEGFVKKLRQIYPEAIVYILGSVKNPAESKAPEAVTRAAEKIMAADQKVKFISDINTWGVEISGDGTHPTPKGYLTYAEHLKTILQTDFPAEETSSQPQSSVSQPAGQNGTDRIHPAAWIVPIAVGVLAIGAGVAVYLIRKKKKGAIGSLEE